MISTAEPAKKSANILGKQMTYIEAGSGDPIVFLHGNPTSSYLWRNIIPHLEPCGRCIAPDLIGMGDSEKLDESGPDSYRFEDHSQYLDALLDHLQVHSQVTFVIHDWGSALGFDWARRHASAIKGIAYMEALVRPMQWDEWPEMIRSLFQGFRSSAGEEMILEKNIFVEKVLPGSVLRGLSDAEMAVYRRPFSTPGESRRPTLSWPRQIPLSGEPPEVVDVIEEYAKWLSSSQVAKLFINADPGAILTGPMRDFCRQWPNQTEITVRGSHFIQEDSPNEIGEALAAWYQKIA